MVALVPHPALNAFPLPSVVEYSLFLEDVRERGLLTPIARQRGQLLDGRTRIRACEELGIKPRFVDVDGDPFFLVVSLNLQRRHLNESQRAIVANRLARLGHGVTKQRSKFGSLTRKEASHVLNVSPATIAAAKVVETKGVPELAAAVESGELAVSTAAEIAKHAPARQREILKKSAKEPRGFALALARESTPKLVSIASRITEAELVALKALHECGRKSGDSKARAGAHVLSRIVPAVAA